MAGGQGVYYDMQSESAVCLFVCYDAVKSSRQRRQSGGGVDVWLSVNTVKIIIMILYITVRRRESLLTRHTTTTTNSNTRSRHHLQS